MICGKYLRYLKPNELTKGVSVGRGKGGKGGKTELWGTPPWRAQGEKAEDTEKGHQAGRRKPKSHMKEVRFMDRGYSTLSHKVGKVGQHEKGELTTGLV